MSLTLTPSHAKRGFTSESMTMPSYHIASIPGDGIGPEVISAAVEVVEKLASTMKTFSIDFTTLPWGSNYWKEHGSYVPKDYLETYRKFDASLFGSVGAPGEATITNDDVTYKIIAK